MIDRKNLEDFSSISVLQIVNLYKNRWQIELFFRVTETAFKIKKFWDTTDNAVRIQISTAIIAYCLVAIVQHDMHLERSIYEVLQALSITLTDKTPLKELFEKTNFNDVKELLSPSPLVNRMSPREESVGGPVDVAEISKGDGFIRIKRKKIFYL